MAWPDQMIPIVRYLVNDVANTPPTYSDTRLEQTIVIAAQLMVFDLNFDQTYAIDIAENSITPDPTATIQTMANGTNRDDAFIKLTSLKAALIIVKGELQTYGLTAIRVSDGPSSIDYTQVVEAVKLRYRELNDEYEEARMQYQIGNRTGFGVTSLRCFSELTTPGLKWRNFPHG